LIEIVRREEMEKLLRDVYTSEKKKKCLAVIGKVCVYTNVVFFALVLMILALGDEWWDAAIAAGAAALGYIAVTVARKLFNYPRPYEIYDFYTVKPREKKGESFPSRHCYSAFVITTLSFLVSPLVFCGLLVLALLIATSRVLLGIHFVRDVLCGAAIGVIFGVIGILTSILV
jgi:membrane-associated phospholipid phosphatase